MPYQIADSQYVASILEGVPMGLALYALLFLWCLVIAFRHKDMMAE